MLTGSKVLGAQQRAERVRRRISAVLDAEGDGDVLDGLDVVFADNFELDGGVHGYGSWCGDSYNACRG